MYKAFLFDIDGTLISSGGAGNRSLDRVCKKLYGIEKVTKEGGFRCAGRTDPMIIREICEIYLKRKNVSDKEVEEALNEYLEVLPGELKKSEDYKVHDGVKEFLEFLKKDKKNVIGLATGNLEKGARIKLAKGDLNKYFSFGGFSCDAEDRAEILAVAKKRAEEFCGEKISNETTFIIGDTPRDILACKKNNFRMIAVASGPPSYEDLEKEKPEFLLRSLEDLKSLDSIFN